MNIQPTNKTDNHLIDLGRRYGYADIRDIGFPQIILEYMEGLISKYSSRIRFVEASKDYVGQSASPDWIEKISVSGREDQPFIMEHAPWGLKGTPEQTFLRVRVICPSWFEKPWTQ